MFRVLLKVVGGFLAAVLALAVTLVVVAAIARTRPRQLLRPTGPAAVGRVELSLRDTSRVDPLASDGRTREMAVWIWYPAVTHGDEARAPYYPRAWAGALNRSNGLASVFFQDNTVVRTNSIPNATIQGTPPVVVLLPGLGRAVPDYSTLAEDLASHGYAVVGVNITESSDIVEFPDGHVVRGTPQGSINEKSIDAWYPAAERLTNVWVDDAAFVVATLDRTPPAIGRLDFGRVAYVGHSMGGAAAFELGRRDSNAAASVDLDGTLWTEVRHAGPRAPGLFLTATVPPGKCDPYCQRSAADRAIVRAVSPVLEFELVGSRHFNFSDVGLLFGPLSKPIGALGPINGGQAVVVTRDVVRAFLDQQVHGTGASELDSTIAAYPELQAKK